MTDLNVVQADVMSWSSSGASRKAALIKRGWWRHESAEVKQAESFPWSIRNWDIDFSHYWFPTNARKVYSLHIFTYIIGSLWPLVYFNLTFIINCHFAGCIFTCFWNLCPFRRDPLMGHQPYRLQPGPRAQAVCLQTLSSVLCWCKR